MNTLRHYCHGLIGVGMVGLIQMSCESEPPDTGPSENLIYHETFEQSDAFTNVHNKEVGDWEYALQIVDSMSYQGDRSVRFEIRDDQPYVAQGIRSEVTIIMGTNQELTREAWYSFAVFFPDTFISDTTYDVISQWYYLGSPVRLLTKRDRFLIDIGNDSLKKEKIYVGELTRDTWHEFVFHFIHSPNDDGYVAVWHNGKQSVSRAGGNLYTDSLPKWKVGIYKASFETGASLAKRRVVYFDNLKIGNQYARYRDMEPGRP
ncbi:MAG TPA: polysaccharide lyase [Chryseosolibacter sp.]